MREILFRGKTAKRGKWVYGWFVGKTCDSIFGKAKTSAQIIDGDLLWHKVDKNSVGQCTGLKDANGNMIFEGDIVTAEEYTPEDGGYGVVRYDEGTITVSNNDICGTFYENYWPYNFEIVGNVYDNPELVKT